MRLPNPVLALLFLVLGFALPGDLRANLAPPGASWEARPGTPGTDLDADLPERALALLFLEVRDLAEASHQLEGSRPSASETSHHSPLALVVLLDLPASALDELADWADLRAYVLDRRVYEFAGTDPPGGSGTEPGTEAQSQQDRVRELSSGVVSRVRQTSSHSKTRVRGFGISGGGIAPSESAREARFVAGLQPRILQIRTGFVSLIDGPNRYRWVGNNPLRYIDPNGLSFFDGNLTWSDWNRLAWNTGTGALLSAGIGFATAGPAGALVGLGYGAVGGANGTLLGDLGHEGLVQATVAYRGSGDECEEDAIRAEVTSELAQVSEVLGPLMFRTYIRNLFGGEGGGGGRKAKNARQRIRTKPNQRPRSPTSRRKWQVTQLGSDRKAVGAMGTYRRSSSDGTWWSQDTVGHGGSVWKVFKEEAGGLRWIADADEFGDYIPKDAKHKGPTGMFIPNQFLRFSNE